VSSFGMGSSGSFTRVANNLSVCAPSLRRLQPRLVVFPVSTVLYIRNICRTLWDRILKPSPTVISKAFGNPYLTTPTVTGGVSFFRRVRKVTKSECLLGHVCPSFRLSAWNNSAPIGRIIKFYI